MTPHTVVPRTVWSTETGGTGVLVAHGVLNLGGKKVLSGDGYAAVWMA